MELLEIEKSKDTIITLEKTFGSFCIKEWVHDSCENRIFLSQDDIEEICNKVLEHKKGEQNV